MVRSSASGDGAIGATRVLWNAPTNGHGVHIWMLLHHVSDGCRMNTH